MTSAPVHAATAPSSGIGSESPSWIQVSPAYARSGLVVAVAFASSPCQTGCTHLWISHDGGASWHVAQAQGWNTGSPVIAVDASGHEVMYSGTDSSLQRSDDGGQTWQGVGGGSFPSVLPTYASDAGVAVAGSTSPDYELSRAGTRTVAGSGGSLADIGFMFAPTYPQGGAHPAALLSAADKSSGLPVIQRCSADLSCSGSTSLPGSGTFSIPVLLVPSSAYAQDGAVFALSQRGIYKSGDAGGSFTPLAVAPVDGATATATPGLALAPGYAEAGPVRTLYASLFQVFTSGTRGRSGGGVFRSDNGGATWRDASGGSPLTGGSTALAIAPDGRLFAGYTGENSDGQYSAGLLCSTDGGRTWQAACPSVGQSAAATPGTAPSVESGSGSATCGAGCASSAAGGRSVASGVPVANAGGAAGETTSPAPSADAAGAGEAAVAVGSSPGGDRRGDRGVGSRRAPAASRPRRRVVTLLSHPARRAPRPAGLPAPTSDSHLSLVGRPTPSVGEIRLETAVGCKKRHWTSVY